MELTIIRHRIKEIRSQKVLLDRDLAEIYGVQTRDLNKAVKRNIRRFEGEDFMFQLTIEEFKNWKSQFMISNGSDKTDLMFHFGTSSWGGTRKLPYAFTQLGVAMLSSVLNSEVAIDANRKIMRAFVMLQQFAQDYKELADKLQEMEEKYDRQFSSVNEAITYLLQKDKVETEQKSRKKIGFVQNKEKTENNE